MSEAAVDEHEALLQFLYVAPVGLIELDPDGQIRMINPRAAALLLPLGTGRTLHNLFDALEPVAPELRHLVSAAASLGVICEGHRLQVSRGQPGRQAPRFLSVTLVRVAPTRLMAVLDDVSRVVEQEQALHLSEAWINAILRGVRDYALMTLDAQGRVLGWNESIGRLTGRTAADVVGRPYSQFHARDSIDPHRMADLLREADEDGWSLDDGWRQRADGSRFYGSTLIAPLRASSAPSASSASTACCDPPPHPDPAPAGPPCYSLVLRDITEHRDAALRLRMESRADPLTGLYNRRAFFEAMELEMRRARRARRPLSLVVFDADHFKQVNDRHGHAAGDRVLCHLAGLLTDLTREIDVVARLGGEEFAVLMPATDGEAALCVAHRICRAAQEARRTEPLAVTLSAGVAALGAQASADDLLQRADRALYAAKAAGRNRACADAAEPVQQP